MLSLYKLISESAEADIAQLVHEVKRFGLMSLSNDVSEICSRSRVTAYAQSLGLSPGSALDLSVTDPDDGRPWDFDIPAKRSKASLDQVC